MNFRYHIFCDALTKEDIQDTDIIDIYDNSFTMEFQDNYLVNDSDFKLFGVHFPFTILENMISAYTEAVVPHPNVPTPPLRVKIYINSSYSHQWMVEEHGSLLKEHYPLVLSLYRSKSTILNGPLMFDKHGIWEIKNDRCQIQIVSVYKYNKTKVQIET